MFQSYTSGLNQELVNVLIPTFISLFPANMHIIFERKVIIWGPIKMDQETACRPSTHVVIYARIGISFQLGGQYFRVPFHSRI